MLAGYAAAHQHPGNVAVHMVGIPTIMLGVLIPLTWVAVEIGDFRFNLAPVLVIALALFYFKLDKLFSVVFLLLAWLLALLAAVLGELPLSTAGTIAAAAFFGGYLAQFVGHAIEKSMPVLVKHPLQANLAAPFFVVVEIFKIFGWRDALFNEVQHRIVELRRQQATVAQPGH